MRKNTCFIIGHRPQRFKFKYHEDYKLCIKIKKVLKTEIIRQYEENHVGCFWVEGAIGVCCWSAEIILELRRQDAYRDMELSVALPFPTFTERFDLKQKARWRDILKECTDSVTVSLGYSPEAYQKCCRYIVDRSQFGIAIYDNDKSVRSGTGMKVQYAQKKGMQMSFIHPDTAIAEHPIIFIN